MTNRMAKVQSTISAKTVNILSLYLRSDPVLKHGLLRYKKNKTTHIFIPPLEVSKLEY